MSIQTFPCAQKPDAGGQSCIVFCVGFWGHWGQGIGGLQPAQENRPFFERIVYPQYWEKPVTPQEQFLSKRQRYQPIALPQHVSDEALVRDWTLLDSDHHEIARYRKSFRVYIAIQICAVRLYGRFVNHVHEVSPHIVNYLGQQLD